MGKQGKTIPRRVKNRQKKNNSITGSNKSNEVEKMIRNGITDFEWSVVVESKNHIRMKIKTI